MGEPWRIRSWVHIGCRATGCGRRSLCSAPRRCGGRCRPGQAAQELTTDRHHRPGPDQVLGQRGRTPGPVPVMPQSAGTVLAIKQIRSRVRWLIAGDRPRRAEWITNRWIQIGASQRPGPRQLSEPTVPNGRYRGKADDPWPKGLREITPYLLFLGYEPASSARSSGYRSE
jgi:hypothetical protein